MAKTLEPENDSDRLRVIREVPEAVKNTPLVPSMVTTMMADELLPVMGTFEQTFDLRAQAIAQDKAARVEGKALDGEHDVGFRRFSPTVQDARGIHASGELSKMTGGVLPNEVVRRPLHDEHLLTGEILRQVPLRSDLSYDTTRYAELAAVHAKMPGMLTTLSTTALAVKTTTDAHKAARATFDAVYGRFRRVVRAAGGDELVRALLPEFISQSPRRAEKDAEDEGSSAGDTEGTAQAAADQDDMG